jgi:hypothetical protein
MGTSGRLAADLLFTKGLGVCRLFSGRGLGTGGLRRGIRGTGRGGASWLIDS